MNSFDADSKLLTTPHHHPSPLPPPLTSPTARGWGRGSFAGIPQEQERPSPPACLSAVPPIVPLVVPFGRVLQRIPVALGGMDRRGGTRQDRGPVVEGPR